MTPKEYLMQYRQLSARLANIAKDLKKLRDERNSLAMNYDGMPHGTGKSDKVGRLATLIADTEQELLWARYDLVQKQKEIAKTIAKVENADYSRLLHMRYIEGLTWEEIAVKMHFTFRWVLVLHGRALEEIKKVLENS